MNTSNNAVNHPSVNPAGTNLLDTAAASGKFATFCKVVEQAGMSETLRGPGPFTVFAPTDAAFQRLPTGLLESLLKPENKKELISLLNYHVVQGRQSAADIGKLQNTRTLDGQTAPIKRTGEQIRIDGALLTAVDIDSGNGVLHAIDKVNMPVPTKQ